MNYVSIHQHSSYSLLDGLASPEELVDSAVKLGMTATGLSDHGSISGAIRFYKACEERSIKPLIGIEAYFCDNADDPKKGESRYHICLFAKSEKGLRSIYALMSKSHEKFYYVPRFDFLMMDDLEDVIVTTACAGGLLRHPNAPRLCNLMKERFGGDFYLEVMPIDFEDQYVVNGEAIRLGGPRKIPIIVSNDVHYLNKEDEKTHNFLLKMHTKGKFEFNVSGLYMKTGKEIIDSLKQMHGKEVKTKTFEEWINNTQRLADSTNVKITKGDMLLPKIENKINIPTNGLNKEYKKRLKYELDVITKKGYLDYFNMVLDLVNWAKSQGMEPGAGRGSAAGSLVCYLLGITGIDPIKEGLLFERFLNPDRSDYPDIDIDFPRSRRPEIGEYLKQKYGKDRVANISTIAEMRPKSAFRDVARQFGVPFPEANSISAVIDNEISFAENMAKGTDVALRVKKLPSYEDIVYLTEKISGTLRQTGTHAAGFVIAPKPLIEYGIIEKKKDDTAINWGMKEAEYLGLIKVDILGLRTLDIIGEARSLIKQRHKVDINWKDISVDTPEILKEFGDGHTVGIFQFESAAMTHLVKRLFPITSKNLLVDANALVRPGPNDSGMTDRYIARHQGEIVESPPYGEFTDPLTRETHHCIIYQEQVIRILVELAGYTIPKADIVRRVFAKKQSKEEFEKHREDFVAGCSKTSGVPENLSSALFDDLEAFSRYGFNKSHAAAYTELGLRQMWLKVNYPLEYMMALFKWTDEEDKRTRFREECTRLDIEIALPDINLSKEDFSISGDQIRIGLRAIKNVGESTVEAIMKQRKIRPFDGIADARLRLPQNKVNKKAFTNLLLTGCFDSFDVNHKAFLESDDDVEDFTEEEKQINRATLLPGVYSLQMEAECSMDINTVRLEKFQDYIRECTECDLCKFYHSPVPFYFTDKSKIFIVGEAPGEDEVEAGEPFVGKAGKVLMDKLEAHGIYREDLYISNVFKCRPLNNKLPLNPPKDCYEILKKELQIVQPKLVVALGGTAKEFFTGNKQGIQGAADKNTVCVELVDTQLVPVLYAVHPASTFYGDGDVNGKRLDVTAEHISDIFWRAK